jgi:hypothetical protein
VACVYISSLTTSALHCSTLPLPFEDAWRCRQACCGGPRPFSKEVCHCRHGLTHVAIAQVHARHARHTYGCCLSTPTWGALSHIPLDATVWALCCSYRHASSAWGRLGIPCGWLCSYVPGRDCLQQQSGSTQLGADAIECNPTPAVSGPASKPPTYPGSSNNAYSFLG